MSETGKQDIDEIEPRERKHRYYFKSPSDLAAAADRPAAGRVRGWFSNRGRLVLLADLVILMLVFVVLQFRGSFVRREAPSLQTIRVGALDISAAFPGAKSGAGARVYVTLRNSSQEVVRFPATGPYELRGWAVEFAPHDGTTITCEQEVGEPIMIRPGRNGDFTIRCAHVSPGKTDITLRMRFAAGERTLKFPPVWIER